MLRWLDAGVRGVGQVVFVPGRWSGLVVLAGFAWADLRLALGALAGSLVGAATAWGLRRQLVEIKAGLWGFNGALVGLAGLALGRGWWGLAFAALTVPVAMALARVFSRIGLSAYTLPFIVVTWAMVVVPPAPLDPPTPQAFSAVTEVLEGLAQIFLVDHEVAGLAVLLALALYRPWWALVAGLASLAGLAVALVGPELAAAPRGLFGFSAALTALALSGGPATAARLAWALVGAGLAAGITLHLPWPGGLPALTLPFVLATWIMLLVERAWGRGSARLA